MPGHGDMHGHGGMPPMRRGHITDGEASNMYGMHRRIHVTAVYDFENKEHNKFRVDLGHMNDDFHAQYPYTTGLEPLRLVYNKDKEEWYHNTQNDISAEYTGRTAAHDYQIRTYYTTLKKESYLVNRRPLLPKFGPMDFERMLGMMHPKVDVDAADYHTWVVEGKNTRYIGNAHNVTYGGEYKNVFYEGTRLGGSQAGAQKVKKAHAVSSYAGFIEDLWQVNEKLLVVPSLRYEHNSRFGSVVTPKIGLTYEATPHIRVKANYGKGYKAPTISELYMNMNHAMGPYVVSIIGNPALQPEHANCYDVSVEGEDGKLFMKATYFTNRVHNLIEGRTVEWYQNQKTHENIMPKRIQYDNIGEARINGTEFMIGAHLTPAWTVKAQYNYLDAEDVGDGSRLSGRPETTTTVQVRYDDRRADGIAAVLSGRFIGNYGQAVGRGSIKNYSYHIWDIMMQKKWRSGVTLTFGIDNLANMKNDNLSIGGRAWRLAGQWKL